MKKVILVDIVPNGTKPEELEGRMAELESLVATYGSVVVLKRVQKRDTPDYHTFVGSGKIEEVMKEGEELGAELVIIGNILKSNQIYHINEIFEKAKSKLKAWDRVDLILKIFELHATSPEARLQIELAAIKHMGPRIFGMGLELSRQGGAGGGGGGGANRGLGETNTEIMKRHLRENEKRITEKLHIYERTRAQHRQSRKRKDFKTIGIVGYTNSGKSSLMNALTRKGVLAENKLFATLGTSVGKMYLETPDFKGKEVLLNDTIGFIRDLPPNLIKAFSSTLEDSVESDFLLHVIDASDPKIIDKMEVVEKMLEKIGANQYRINVFNKIDAIDSEKIESLKKEFAYLDPIFISANEKIGFDELRARILKEIN